MLIDHSYPVRFGIVPIVETEEGLKMAKIFYYLTQNYGRQQTMRFFNSVLRLCFYRRFHSSRLILDMLGGTKQQLDWSFIRAEFEALVANEGIMDGGEAMPYEDVLESAADDIERKLLKARTYAERLSTTTTSSPEGHVFINGKYHILDDVCCYALVWRCNTKLYGTRVS
jgi:UDP-glucose:glycoprotein glucosyltransferase